MAIRVYPGHFIHFAWFKTGQGKLRRMFEAVGTQRGEKYGFYFNVLGPVMGKCEKELEKGRKERGFKESSKEPSFFAQIHHSRLLFHYAKVHRTSTTREVQSI